VVLAWVVGAGAVAVAINGIKNISNTKPRLNADAKTMDFAVESDSDESDFARTASEWYFLDGECAADCESLFGAPDDGISCYKPKCKCGNLVHQTAK